MFRLFLGGPIRLLIWAILFFALSGLPNYALIGDAEVFEIPDFLAQQEWLVNLFMEGNLPEYLRPSEEVLSDEELVIPPSENPLSDRGKTQESFRSAERKLRETLNLRKEDSKAFLAEAYKLYLRGKIKARIRYYAFVSCLALGTFFLGVSFTYPYFRSFIKRREKRKPSSKWADPEHTW